jgi:hypothetical protein
MKKHILSFGMIVAMIGSIAAGCGSSKSAGGSDTTKKDTTKVSTPPAESDTAKKDTTKKDTTHH